jgi:site-specific DNA recombinase
VRQVFELYATGEYSIDLLEATMADLGLTTRPSGRWPREQPVSDSKLHHMLSDPYYAGWVTVDGQLIRGRHEALISQGLFDRVQDVLETRSRPGTRDRVLNHYLKGMLYCQRCYRTADRRVSRLVYTEARGRNGEYYGYYLCRSRQQGLCDLPHLPVDQVEDAVRRSYIGLCIPDDFATEVRAELEATIADQQQLTRDLHESLGKQLLKLGAREERLIDLAANGALSKTKIQERANAIQIERARIRASLADATAELEVGAQRLLDCLDLVTDPARLYDHSPDETRRQLNQTFYTQLFLDDDPTVSVTRGRLNPPFDEIREASWVYHRQKALSTCAGRRPAVPQSVPGDRPVKAHRSSTATPIKETRTPVLADIFSVSVSSERVMVELRGFEPLTPSMRTRCATRLRHSPKRDASGYHPASEHPCVSSG